MYVYIVQNRIWILTDVLFSSFKNQERSWRKNCSYDLELAFFFLLLSSSRKANDKSNLSNFLLWLLFLEGKSSHSAPTTATKCFVKRIPLSKMALRETIPNPASIHTYLAGWQFWRVAKICNMCITNRQYASWVWSERNIHLHHQTKWVGKDLKNILYYGG